MNPTLTFAIIEDSLKVCIGIKERMDDFAKWECCGFAHHIDEAIKILNTHKPALIFLDWALQGGSAYEVLSNIVSIPQYQPYIVFNTGYQSENPEIPQQIINNYKIDKYLVKPLWENIRIHLATYLKEAELKWKQHPQKNYTRWVKDVNKQQHHIDFSTIVCIQQCVENPYQKALHFVDGAVIVLKTSWPRIYKLLQECEINFFITNSKQNIVVKSHICQYKRPAVYLKHNKIEVVKNKLAAFEKWIADSD